MTTRPITLDYLLKIMVMSTNVRARTPSKKELSLKLGSKAFSNYLINKLEK